MAKKKLNKTTKPKARAKKTTKPKGVRYIAKQLKKYGGKKYKDYKEAQAKAREVIKQLKEQGLKVNVRNINSLVRKHRVKKTPEKPPFVPPAMFEQSVFWDIIDTSSQDNYIDLVAQSSNQIEFRSNVSPEPFDVFNGGDKIAYETHFKAFADYCNRILNLMRANDEVPTSDDGVLISTTIPKKDKKTGQWYCEIYTCDVYGEDQDYGFDKTNPSAEPTEVIKPNDDPSSIGLPEKPKTPEVPTGGGGPPTPEAPPSKPTSDIELEKLRLEQQERIKKAEILSAEKIKQEKLAQLERLLKEKVITFDQYLQGLKEI